MVSVKVKIVGFKVGVPKPTYNKTIEVRDPEQRKGLEDIDGDALMIGLVLMKALSKSDFISIRKIY